MKDIEGINQKEHFIDLFREIDLFYDNIKDNTDSAFEMLKIVENNKDQETIDVLRIVCSNILDCETKVKEFIERYEMLKKQIFNKSEEETQRFQENIIELHKNIKNVEKESSKQFKQFLKLMASIKVN